MKAYNAPDNKKFSRQIRRDLIVLLLISMGCAIGIVLTLKYSIENNW